MQAAIVTGVFLIVVTAIVEFGPKARLEGKVAELNSQLAPFRAVAVERFGGNEQQALVKLAAQLSDLEAQLKREARTIRRFDVAVVATLAGDWKSSTLPDFSKLFRKGSRNADIRVEVKTKDSDMRWVDFADFSAPKMAAGEGNTWILDYGGQAPVGSWVLGVSRDDLLSCGGLEMELYGIDHDVTKDGVITVVSVTLSFYVNGVPACRCEYRSPFTDKLPEQVKDVKIQLRGSPVPIQPIP